MFYLCILISCIYLLNLRNLNFSNYTSNTQVNVGTIESIGAIGVDEYNDSIVWVTTDLANNIKDNKLYISIDGGITFTNMTSKLVSFARGNTLVTDTLKRLLDYKSITDIEINPKNNDEIYLSISGVYDVKTELYPNIDSSLKEIRILRSTDGGESWVDWSQGLPKPRIPVNDIIFHKQSNGLIFCATDMGIYYRMAPTSSMGEWKCFQNGLPPSIVTEMQINYCENKIYASTFGRGIWSSDIPQSMVINGEREISANTLIDYTMFTPYDIRVTDSSILTITDTLIFSKGRKLIIEPGSRLVINGGAVTGRCGEFWDGIFAMGNTNQAQTPFTQSTIYLNSALVANARRGITTRNPYAWGGHGAIIKATNTIFRNNGKDVEFMQYHNTYVSSSGVESPNQSHFTNCTFELTDEYITTGTDDRMSLWEVNGVKIRGCTFEDKRSPVFATSGTNGIFSFDATYSVDEVCTSSTTPCSSSQRTIFKNLDNGIHAMGSYPTKNISVENTDFIDNTTGATFEGTSSARIVNNTFSSSNTFSLGLYLMSSDGYHVEGNHFISNMTAGPTNRSIGIMVYNKHGNDNQVYRNSYTNIKEGIEAVGQNKEVKGRVEQGLVLKCNDFTGSNSEDMYVRDDPSATSSSPFLGIKKFQGVAGGSNQQLAGNLFSNTNTTKLWINNQVENFTYFHHNEVTTPRVKPSNWTTSTVLMNGSSVPLDASSCPDSTGVSSVTLGTLISYIQVNRNLEDSTVAVLQGLIDGGNTEVLITQVTTTTNTSAYQHYLDIMNEAGYVSEEVLEEVAANENGFTLAMIRDILVANSHAASSEEIQQILDDRIHELPPFMRIQILAGLNQVSPLEYMQRIIASYSTQKNAIVSKGLQFLRRDTTSTLQDFESLLLNTGNPYHQLEMVTIYDALGETSLAEDLLQTMNDPDNFSESFVTYFEDFKNLRTSMQNWENQNFTELEETQLQVLQGYEEVSNPTSATARKLLLLNGEDVLERPYYFSEDENESEQNKQREFAVEGLTTSHFSLFPNPTKNFVTLDYTIIEQGKERKVVLINSAGKLVKSQLLVNSRDQVVVKLDNLPQGNYVCFILVDGKSIGSKQLTVIK